MGTLCHAEYWRWDNKWSLIVLYQDASRAFYTAATWLEPGNWIMVDGRTADEAVQAMRVALPGAVWSRVVGI